MANSNAKVTRSQVLAKAMMMTDVFTAEEIEVMGKMIASIEKKSSKGGVSDKVMAERQAERQAIEGVLKSDDGATAVQMTATAIANAVGISVQRASARLKELIADGVVYKVDAKGKNPAMFGLAEGEDE